MKRICTISSPDPHPHRQVWKSQRKTENKVFRKKVSTWVFFLYKVHVLMDKPDQLSDSQMGVEINYFIQCKQLVSLLFKFKVISAFLYCQDYMDDVHQKTILLKHTTVKVPGKRPPKATTPAQGKTFKLIRCCLQLLLAMLCLG